MVRPHHRFMLAEHLAHIDFLDEQVERVSDKIGQQIEAMSQSPEPDETPPAGGAATLSWAESVELLDSAPGVDKKAAEIVLAEMGIDMTQFDTADHLTVWAGLAPGNNHLGSKRGKGKTREGNRNLRQIMVQVAWRRCVAKGVMRKRSIVVWPVGVAKSEPILLSRERYCRVFWYMLTRGEAYRDLGGDYFDQRRKDVKVNVLTKQLEKLGYAVQLEPIRSQLLPA